MLLLFYLLYIAAATLVALAVEILPLALHMVVCLHLHMRLAPFEAILNITRNQVGKQQGVGSLVAVFRQYSHQQEVYDLGMSELQGS